MYQQMRHWMAAGVFEEMVHDLRSVLRMCASSVKKGSKVHMAVDTLSHLLALWVTPAN